MQRISLDLFSSFVGKEKCHWGGVWWAGGMVGWVGKILQCSPPSSVVQS